MKLPSFLSSIPSLSSMETFASSVVHGGFLGIDIGTSSAKIVQLSKEGSTFVLDTYGEIELGPYADRDAHRAVHLSTAQLATVVLDLLQAVDAKSRRGGIALPFSATLINVVEVPKRDVDQMEKLIVSEVKPLIPVPIDTVYLNWVVLTDETAVLPSLAAMEEKKAVSPPKEKVMLIATAKEVTEAYKKVAETDQIAIDFLEIEFFSAARACFGEAKGPALILDFGASTVKMYLMNHSGVVVATHATSFGCEAMTEGIMKNCEWNFDRSESIKRSRGLIHTDTLSAHENTAIDKAIETTLSKICDDALRFLKDGVNSSGVDPQKIFLIGGGAIMPGMVDAVHKHLKIETTLPQPFGYTRAPVILQDAISQMGPKYAVALGLAFRALQA